MVDEFITVTITVNGEAYAFTVTPRTSLLDILRDQLDLTGAKVGCGYGKCGACVVIMDGEPVRACIVKAGKADGKSVRTVEGLAAKDGTLHPVQEAMVRSGAVQCGFCTPGIIMELVALLERNSSPSKEELMAALEGHLCRCTGYEAIVEGAELAVELFANK